MNYEIEQALRQKADNYKVYELESEIRQLKSKNTELQYKIERALSQLNNYQNVIIRLIQILDENEVDPNFSLNELINQL